VLSNFWQVNVLQAFKRSKQWNTTSDANSDTHKVTHTSKNVTYTVNSTKFTRDENIHILSVHFQWLLQNFRGKCRQNKICAVKLWKLYSQYTVKHICTGRIIITRNLITFAVLHENTRCFVKMKANVIRYIIQLQKY